jgi:ABC-type branched-subunit amino acid transport system substrate-binding protein
MRRVIAALALAGLTAACGSTVQVTGQQTLGDGLGGPASGTGGGDLSGGTTGSPAGTTGLGGAVGTSGSATGAGSAGGSAVGTSSGGTTTTGQLPVPGNGTIPTTGPGWDAKHVYIGVTTQKDVNTAAHSVGANGLDAGDQEAEVQAVAAYLNAHGGIFGRQIVPVFKDEATVSTQQNPDAAGAATCSYFTSDRKVIALFSPVTLMDVDSFRTCMAQHKVPLFSASVAPVSQQIAHKYAPYFFQSVAPTWDALAPALVKGLAAQGYFASAWNVNAGSSIPGKATIGILTDNTVGGQQTAAILKRAIEAAGHPVAQVFSYDAHNNSTMSSAVLQFRGNGVDHVLSTDSALVAFQLQASSQSYRPRYGISSINAPITFLQTNGGPSQNTGDLGVGWAPTLDVDDANDPGVINSTQATCNDIMSKAHQNLAGKRLGRAVAYAFCDGLFLIAKGATAGGGFTGVQIYNGMLKVAPTFPSAFSFAPGLQPNRLFIPGGVRPLAFVSSCSCFRYTSKVTSRL